MLLYAISIRQHFFAYIFYFFIQRNSIKNYRIFFSSLSIFPKLHASCEGEGKSFYGRHKHEKTRASNSSQLFTLIVSSPPASSFLTESYKSFLQNEWKIPSSTENEGIASFHMEISWERVENRMWKVWLVCLWEFFIRNWKNAFPVSRADELFPHFQLHTSLWHSAACCCVYCEEGRRKHENFHRFSLSAMCVGKSYILRLRTRSKCWHTPFHDELVTAARSKGRRTRARCQCWCCHETWICHFLHKQPFTLLPLSALGSCDKKLSH